MWLRPGGGSRRRLIVAGCAIAACALLAGATTAALEHGGGKHRDPPRKPAITDAEAAESFPEPGSSAPHELAISPETAASDSHVSPGAPSDAEVRRELKQLERYNRGTLSLSGHSKQGGLDRGLARPPAGAPGAVAELIAGGNAIARFPYRLGGGHGSFVDDAYDCSGSVSYALAAAGMLGSPVTSGQLAHWGVPGPGRWATVFANSGHVFMEVAGLRFDTSGRGGLRGSRWQASLRPARGFAVRHWPGL